MRKIKLCFSILFIFLFLFSACQNSEMKKEPSDTNEILHKSNFIIPYKLTHAEEELLNLVCSGNRIEIFNFSTNDDIKSVFVWCEEYEKGQFNYKYLERKSEISRRGRIAITIDDQEMHMSVEGTSNKGSSTTYTTNGNINVSDNSLRKQTEIKSDSEIALMVYAIKQADNDENEFLQIPSFYIENPERLSDFDKVYLFKCKFSEEAVD